MTYSMMRFELKKVYFFLYVRTLFSFCCLLVHAIVFTYLSFSFVALEAFFKVVEVCVLGARELSLELSERCTNSSNALFSMRHTKVDDLEEAVNFTPFSMKAEHCIVNYLVA